MKNERTMELITNLNHNVLSNTFVTAWIMRQIMKCGSMYERAARDDAALAERIEKSFRRAMDVAGCRSEIPENFEDMAETVTCVTTCISRSVGVIKERSSTRIVVLLSSLCSDDKKNPWDDVLEYVEKMRCHVLAAMDFTDSGSINDLPINVFAEIDEMKEIAYLCEVLCAM